MVKFVEKLLFTRGVQRYKVPIRCLTIGFHKLKKVLCHKAIAIFFYFYIWFCYLLPIHSSGSLDLT